VSWRLVDSITLRSPNTCAALEKLSDSKDINWGWKNINKHIKSSDKENLSLYELDV